MSLAWHLRNNLDSDVGDFLQRRLVSWQLNEFLERLSGKSTINLASLRQEFRTCCENLPMPW
jgi:hypothetical protein